MKALKTVAVALGITLAALVVILLIWFFWPATRVTNLDSHSANIIAFGDSLTVSGSSCAKSCLRVGLSQPRHCSVM